jgi:hypothetical protein
LNFSDWSFDFTTYLAEIFSFMLPFSQDYVGYMFGINARNAILAGIIVSVSHGFVSPYPCRSVLIQPDGATPFVVLFETQNAWGAARVTSRG